MSLMEVKSFPHDYLNLFYYHILKEKLNRFIRNSQSHAKPGFVLTESVLSNTMRARK